LRGDGGGEEGAEVQRDIAAGDALPGRRQAGRRAALRVRAEAEVPGQGEGAVGGGVRVLPAGQPGGVEAGRADRGRPDEEVTLSGGADIPVCSPTSETVLREGRETSRPSLFFRRQRGRVERQRNRLPRRAGAGLGWSSRAGESPNPSHDGQSRQP